MGGVRFCHTLEALQECKQTLGVQSRLTECKKGMLGWAGNLGVQLVFDDRVPPIEAVQRFELRHCLLVRVQGYREM